MPELIVRRAEINRAVLVAVILFWTAFVSLYTLRSALVAPPEMLGRLVPRLSIALFGAALSWIMYRIVEMLPLRSITSRTVGTIAMSVPIAVAFATGDALVGGVVALDGTLRCPHSDTCTWFDVWALEIDNAIVWIFVFAAWGLVHLTLRAAAEMRAADALAHAEHQAARLAEIRALRYQINPHFLFNCLNSLTALVRRKDTSQAEEMIGELGQFIRFGLTVDPVADVTLDSEIEMQARYLELEQRRFAARMGVRIAVESEVTTAAVPPLILQPLIENAIKHGVDRVAGMVTIGVTATLAAPDLVSVIIANHGARASSRLRDHPEGFGIGQQNVAARLTARFGPAASFFAGWNDTDCYRAELLFPLIPVAE